MKPGGLGAGRIAVMVLFAFSCFGLLLFLWLSFGGPIPLKPKGYRIQAAFPEATTLAEQADVRIAGVPVGRVVRKELDPKGDGTLATIEIDREYAPIRSQARAMLRQKTLLGETYVQLEPGPKAAEPLPEGGRLADVRVQETVEFDEFLEIFPEETRRAFRRWQENGAKVIAGRDADLNAALGNIGPFAESGSELLGVLDRRKAALGSLVRETGTVFEALTEDEESLRAFMADSARWFQATARERESLAESIRIFPTFLDETKSTLARLETFAQDTNPLIEDLRPVTRDLQPTLRDLRKLAPDLRALFQALPALIAASEQGLPNLNRVLAALEPTLGSTGSFLAQLNPILQWLETSNGKVSDFIGIGPNALGGRRSTQNPNGNGHALPQLIMTGSQSILMPQRSRDNRGNSYLVQNLLRPAPGFNDGFEVNPNWDCNHVGVKKPTERRPVDNDAPGCFVAPPLEFKGKRQRFPQITEDMQSSTRSR